MRLTYTKNKHRIYLNCLYKKVTNKPISTSKSAELIILTGYHFWKPLSQSKRKKIPFFVTCNPSLPNIKNANINTGTNWSFEARHIWWYKIYNSVP